MSVIRTIGRLIQGLRKPRAARSPQWRAVRAKWLAGHPECAACGATADLEVHHRVPVHIDPSRELDLANLITLCEGPRRCHLVFGHLGNWKLESRFVVPLAAAYYAALRRL